VTDDRVKTALDYSTGRDQEQRRWSRFGRRNPFRILRRALAILLVFAALYYLMGTDRQKGDAIKIAAIGAIGIAVSYLIERNSRPPAE